MSEGNERPREESVDAIIAEYLQATDAGASRTAPSYSRAMSIRLASCAPSSPTTSRRRG